MQIIAYDFFSFEMVIVAAQVSSTFSHEFGLGTDRTRAHVCQSPTNYLQYIYMYTLFDIYLVSLSLPTIGSLLFQTLCCEWESIDFWLQLGGYIFEMV